MIMVMKKMIFGILSLLFLASPAMADDDKPIKVKEMPVAAQEFIAEHFSGQSIAVAKQEGSFIEKNYDIIFTNGNKLEFDRKGIWTNVDCRYGSVPQAIIPAPITEYVKNHFPDGKVKKIEKENRKYEVELSNDVELKFNNSYELVDVDL